MTRPCIRCGGLERDARGGCRPCRRERDRRAYEANSEVKRARNRAWRAANLDRARAACRLSLARAPERKREGSRRRRALLAKRGDQGLPIRKSHTSRYAVEQCQIRRADGRCVYCQARAATSVDHAMPLSRGGWDSPWNLVACCLPCQRSKGSRTADEYVWFFRESLSHRLLAA